jgi:membrane protein implicated in regulation of membrane protease activity
MGVFGDNEDMLRDVNHPAHTSGGREAVSVACVIIIGSIILFSTVDIPWLPMEVLVFLTLLVAALGFFLVIRVFSRAERQVSKNTQERREEEIVAREAQLQEAKARGDLDRWNNKS